MKKWFIRIGIVFLIIFAVIAVFLILEETDKAVIKPTPPMSGCKPSAPIGKAHPLTRKIVSSITNSLFAFDDFFIEMANRTNPQKEEKLNDTERLPVLDAGKFLNSEKDGIIWLGHAAFFIRLNGKNILIDPVFGNPSFIRKYVDFPSPVEKIRRLDYVLISHDHRDHTDENTLKEIARKFPEARFYAGLRMDELFKSWFPNESQGAGWFQQFKLPDDKIKVFFLPVRHWCRRGLSDTNQRLWGGFIIQGAGKTIYFGGDSGYGSHYKETAEIFPEIDYFLIGIGGYKPRWFMEASHNSPEEAVKAFVDSKAKTLVPMHYGTFDLSDEPPSEPLRLLKEEAQRQNLSERLKPLNINESIIF